MFSVLVLIAKLITRCLFKYQSTLVHTTHSQECDLYKYKVLQQINVYCIGTKFYKINLLWLITYKFQSSCQVFKNIQHAYLKNQFFFKIYIYIHLFIYFSLSPLSRFQFLFYLKASSTCR
jgi:hypothetical protein